MKGSFFLEHLCFLGGSLYTHKKRNIPLAPTNWGHRSFRDFDGRPHGFGSDSKPNHPKVLKASSLLKGGMLGGLGREGTWSSKSFGMCFFGGKTGIIFEIL